jgi:YfiH family protein
MPIEWLVPDWPAPPNVRALSTLRGGGVSVGRYASLNLGGHVQDGPEEVAENRRRLRIAADLPAEPVWLAQVHGVRIANLDAADVPTAAGLQTAAGKQTPPDVPPTVPAAPPAPPVADGAVTRVPGRICAILTADCLPVLFASEAGDAVGAAHAGWRGLAGGVLEASVAALAVAPSALLAWLGPAIGPRHFEVGPEVRDALLQGDPGALTAFEPNARGRFMADLPELARRRLRRLGITRIFGGDACTHTEAARYFSHRRDGETGRQATLVWLECRI